MMTDLLNRIATWSYVEIYVHSLLVLGLLCFLVAIAIKYWP
jgi:hypothetical protein